MKIAKYSFWNDLKWILPIFFLQFLVLLNYSEHDQESLPAPAPDCLCQAGLPSWSNTPLMNRTSPNILLNCKTFFPGSLHPLPGAAGFHVLASLGFFSFLDSLFLGGFFSYILIFLSSCWSFWGGGWWVGYLSMRAPCLLVDQVVGRKGDTRWASGFLSIASIPLVCSAAVVRQRLCGRV